MLLLVSLILLFGIAETGSLAPVGIGSLGFYLPDPSDTKSTLTKGVSLFDPPLLPPKHLPPTQFSPNQLLPNHLPPNTLSPNEPNHLSPNQFSANQFSPNQLSPNQLIPNLLPANTLLPNQRSLNQISTNQISQNQLPQNQISQKQISPDQRSPNQLSQNQRLPNQLSQNQLLPKQLSLNHLSQNPLSPNYLGQHGVPPPERNFYQVSHNSDNYAQQQGLFRQVNPVQRKSVIPTQNKPPVLVNIKLPEQVHTSSLTHFFKTVSPDPEKAVAVSDKTTSDSDKPISDPDSDSYSSFITSQVHNYLYNHLVQKSKVAAKHVGKYGTTRHLKQIFLGRCYEYQYKKGIIEENEWNCGRLWSLFYKAFAFKGPCNVTSEDYMDFLDAVDEKIEENKGLLWSGTRELAHKYSDFLFTGKYTTLEDTLAGYLLNGLTWCGHVKYGINFKECPWKCSLQSPYWAFANARFAQKLHGLVHIVLNGTRMHLDDGKKYPTYMKDRYYLGPNVVPVLKKDNINKIIIIVAHTLHLEQMESCGMGSVQVLEDEIAKKEIPVECKNDPESMRYLLCAQDPEAKECADLKGGEKKQSTFRSHVNGVLSSM